MFVSRSRRSFLKSTAWGAAALALPVRSSLAFSSKPSLEVGEGVVDTTPPLGIEMAGFHRPAGQERRIVGIRRPTAARAIVLRIGDVQAAIVSLDIVAVSSEMTVRVQQQISQQLGIPAANVRLCATHTHSMPAFFYLRQWGAMSPEYMASVEQKIVRAVEMAKADLAPATLSIGKTRVSGASNNRTTKTWKTDEQFTKDSTDAERWLDTMLHVLHFERGEGTRDLLWYHFSAHPVCYQDDQAGPDWPGLVDELVRQRLNMAPSFLQGHCGDVNAGDATQLDWLRAEHGRTRGRRDCPGARQRPAGSRRRDPRTDSTVPGSTRRRVVSPVGSRSTAAIRRSATPTRGWMPVLPRTGIKVRSSAM